MTVTAYTYLFVGSLLLPRVQRDATKVGYLRQWDYFALKSTQTFVLYNLINLVYALMQPLPRTLCSPAEILCLINLCEF